MPIGANIAVIAAGAVLAFAVRVHTHGVSVQAVGAVLMAVGFIGLVLQIRAVIRQRELTAVQAVTPAEAVLVRPGGRAQAAPYGSAAGGVVPSSAPGEPTRRYPDEYTGNEW